MMQGRTGDAKKKTIAEMDRSLCVSTRFKGRAAGESAGGGSGPILIKISWFTRELDLIN